MWGSRSNILIANTIAGNKIGIFIYDPTEFDDGYLPFDKPYNIIMKNNFYFNSRNAYFENIIHNYWRSNYWDSSDYPEVINGKIWFYTLEPHLWIEKSWRNYDWRPVQEPYNISDVDINPHTNNYYSNKNVGLLFLQFLSTIFNLNWV